MTVRDDVRNHFEREAVRHPAPRGLRATTISHARGRGIEKRNAHWIAGAVAALLAMAIIAGLLALGVMRQTQIIPAHSPKLLFHDNLTAAVGGRPFLDDPYQYPAHFPTLKLAASFPATPDHVVTYQTDPALAPSPEDVGRVWGITTAPRIDAGEAQIGDIRYYLESGVITYRRPGNPQSVRVSGPGTLAHAITDESSAIAMTRDFLVARGLFSRTEVQSMPGSAHHNVYPTPNVAVWSVVIERTLGGIPDYGFGLPGATLQVADNGRIDLIMVLRRTIAGQEPLQLISAAEAWRQVTLWPLVCD